MRDPREQFDLDELVRTWVVRHLEIVGEAASAVPSSILQKAPEVPWHLVVATRNRLAHSYFDIDDDQVWATVEHALPPLRRAIERLMADLEDGTGDGA